MLQIVKKNHSQHKYIQASGEEIYVPQLAKGTWNETLSFAKTSTTSP